MELVLVDYEFEYIARDGRQVSIKPNERYILVAKTNDTWWHVRKDQQTKPFYIPAQYVRELPSAPQSLLDLKAKTQTPFDLLSGEERVDQLYTKSDCTTRVRAFTDYTNRMSTFGYPEDYNEVKTSNFIEPVLGQQISAKSRDVSHNLKRHSLVTDFSFFSEPSAVSDPQHQYQSPHVPSKAPGGLSQLVSVSQPLTMDTVVQGSSEGQKTLGDPSGRPFEYQDSDVYESISDFKTPELIDPPPPVLSTYVASTGTAVLQQPSQGRGTDPAHHTEPFPKEQVRLKTILCIFIQTYYKHTMYA